MIMNDNASREFLAWGMIIVVIILWRSSLGNDNTSGTVSSRTLRGGRRPARGAAGSESLRFPRTRIAALALAFFPGRQCVGVGMAVRLGLRLASRRGVVLALRGRCAPSLGTAAPGPRPSPLPLASDNRSDNAWKVFPGE